MQGHLEEFLLPGHARALRGVPSVRLMKGSPKGLYGDLDRWQASSCAGKLQQAMLLMSACSAYIQQS